MDLEDIVKVAIDDVLYLYCKFQPDPEAVRVEDMMRAVKRKGAGGAGNKNKPPPLQALANVLDIDEEKIKDAVKAELGVTDAEAVKEDIAKALEDKLVEEGCLPAATRKEDAKKML